MNEKPKHFTLQGTNSIYHIRFITERKISFMLGYLLFTRNICCKLRDYSMRLFTVALYATLSPVDDRPGAQGFRIHCCNRGCTRHRVLQI